MMINVSKSALAVIEALEAAGEEAYVVGGCVRDALLGREASDWDVCSSALPEKVLALFEHAVPTGIKHGTVTVVERGEAIEVTTFRCEGEYPDRRRPASVAFVRDVNDDLRRRDFTVNAMAWSPIRGLKDPSGGERDLRDRTLRAVGDPLKRFDEDALRIFRALRFASTHGFEIEPNTASALHRCRELTRAVAAERVTAELTGLLRGERAGSVAREYRDVLATRLPTLENADEAVFAALENETSRDVATRLALLCTERDLALLRLDRNTADDVKTLLRLESERLPLPDTMPAARRLVRGAGGENALRYAALRSAIGENADRARELIAAAAEERLTLAIGGRDLLPLGVSGREVGVLLAALLERVTDDELPNERTALLEAAERIYNETNG